MERPESTAIVILPFGRDNKVYTLSLTWAQSVCNIIVFKVLLMDKVASLKFF